MDIPMTDIPLHRVSQLLRSIFELLWNRPDGLPARELLALIPEKIQLTLQEREYSPAVGGPFYEGMVRQATSPLVAVGWLVKNDKGRWYITEEGRQACRTFTNAQELYREALRQFEERRQGTLEAIMTVEMAEEKAWEQVQKFLHGLRPGEFQGLVADLLQAMGYFIGWVAPPEKSRGQVDVLAYVDPVGAKGPRILAQVKHKGQATTLEGLKSFASILGPNDYGLIISTGGFTADAREELRGSAFQRITALDLEAFFDLWVSYYGKLSSKAQARLPLKAVHFLSPMG
jgi:restriction system protein